MIFGRTLSMDYSFYHRGANGFDIDCPLNEKALTKGASLVSGDGELVCQKLAKFTRLLSRREAPKLLGIAAASTICPIEGLLY